MVRLLLAATGLTAYVLVNLGIGLAVLGVIVATGQPVSHELGSIFTGCHFLVAGLVTFCLTVVIHELGHFRAAQRVGSDIQRLELGPLIWEPRTGFRLTSRFNPFAPARLSLVLPTDVRLVSRIVWAGPRANFITGAISLAPVYFVGPILQCWFGFFAVWSFGHWALSMLPLSFGGETSDGLKLWDAWRRGRSAA